MADEYDRTERAIEAALAEHRAEKLTGRQRSDLEWWRRQQSDESVRQVFRALPKKLYCELSGRQPKVINEQASRYGLPLSGSTLDLFEVIAAFHNFLAVNAKKFGKDEVFSLKANEELANLRRKGQLLEIELQERNSQWVSRIEVQSGLAWLVGRLQTAAESIGVAAGKESQKLFNDLLEAIAVEIENGHLDFEEVDS